MTKAELRARIRPLTAALAPAEQVARSEAACRLLAALPEFTGARSIFLFLSIADEPGTESLIHAALAAGKRVAAPRTDWPARTMTPIELSSVDDVSLADRGLLEPRGDLVVAIETIDLVIVPGVAFDRFGRRLGRGGGFYDRFLAHPWLRAVRCGLAFHEQLVEEVPAEQHDASIDLLVTDAGVLRFSQGYRHA